MLAELGPRIPPASFRPGHSRGVTQQGPSPRCAGENAARYAGGLPLKGDAAVEICPGENVRLLFPQRYDPGEDLILFVRAKTLVERAVSVRLSPVDLRFKRPYARPNEMIRVKVGKEKLRDIKRSMEVHIEER